MVQKNQSNDHKNVSISVYDPDPLMSTLSRRKRRQSWESGTSEGSRATKTPRASFDSEISPPPQPLRNNHHHVHAGDLKMRIHVPTTTSSGSFTGNLNGPSKQKKSSNGGSQNNEAVASNLKAVRKLAQRPSISSVSRNNFFKVVFNSKDVHKDSEIHWYVI